MSIADRPSAARSPALQADPRRLTPITLEMYDRMIAAGVFDPAEAHPLELIGGELHMMSPIGDRRADAVDWLARWSHQVIDPDSTLVRIQNPLAIPGSASAPARHRLGDPPPLRRPAAAARGGLAARRGGRHEPRV